MTYMTYRDHDGHDRAWWRTRVQELQQAIRSAEFARDHAYWAQKRSDRENRYEYSRWNYVHEAEKVERLMAQREELKEQFRMAGALPGWVRDLWSDE